MDISPDKPVSVPSKATAASGRKRKRPTATLSNSGESLKHLVPRICGNMYVAWSNEPRYGNNPADVTMGKRRAKS